MGSLETIIVERDGPLAVVTINRPAKLNALSATVLADLQSALSELASAPGPERPRVGILTGAGEKAFVAGADIGAMSEFSPAEALTFAQLGHRVARSLESADFPWIAAVGGFALGGGCELALACDFIYAADTAMFGQPEINLGIIPGFGGTQRLARRVGPSVAREMLYTGKSIDAESARSIGLVNAVFPRATLMEETRKTALAIATKGPLAITAIKRVVDAGLDANLDTALQLEARGFAGLFGTADQREGMLAFLEKRTAEFRGR